MRPRLLAQSVAVTAALSVFDAELLTFQGLLPLWLDRVVSALLWIWFVNLYNFMDGIDGLTATETMTLGLGLAGLAWGLAWGPAEAALGLSLAAAGLGFYLWNRPTGPNLPGRRRLGPPGLPAGRPLASGSGTGGLGRRSDFPTLLPGRFRPHAAPPHAARRTLLDAAP